jgi:hypothetical protein
VGPSERGVYRHRESTLETTFHPDQPPVSGTISGRYFSAAQGHFRDHFSTGSAARKGNAQRDASLLDVLQEVASSPPGDDSPPLREIFASFIGRTFVGQAIGVRCK